MSVHIPDFSKASVLVVGDVMLDRYWQGETSRISPEAPVPIVHIEETKESAGGAGNVALNITSLGASASMVGVIGNDPAGKKIQDLLTQHRVHPLLTVLDQVPTITKLRVLSRHQQLIRLDFEERLLPLSSDALLGVFEKQLSSHKVVVLSDYGKGTLTNIQTLIKLARQAKLPVLIDPKGNDFTKYRGATLLTPNLKEFETIVGPCKTEQEIEQKARQLIEQIDLDALLVTRSEKGMMLIEREKPVFTLPTQARDVFDVTGAGDTAIAVLAAAVAAGQGLPQAVFLANVAAGIVVGKLGAATVTVPELLQAIHLQHMVDHPYIVTEEQLLHERLRAKTHQETVVMTNGCFDLLHAGHIAYLEEAKKLGDYLIVAVNDDQSVQRLKGMSRPIMPLEQRMKVLAGLKSVDYVVPFSEDTPERLITKILPDVLVKGGDYQVEQVAGAQAVLKNGGQVKMLSFVEGCSTSKIIERIKQ